MRPHRDLIRGLPKALRKVLASQGAERAARWKALHGEKGFCFYCGRALNDGRPSRDNVAARTIDHVVPYFAGGANCPFNYVWACSMCNGLKARLPLEGFRAAVAYLSGKAVVFFGEREAGGRWSRPAPLLTECRTEMIVQMEWEIMDRFESAVRDATAAPIEAVA